MAAIIMRRDDFPQRLQLLASCGLHSCLERLAPKSAVAIGSIAAVEFCLDQLPALVGQHAAAPMVAAGAGEPAAAAAGGPLAAADPAAQQWQWQMMGNIATAAAMQGQVAVLRLLRGRGFVFHARDVFATLNYRFFLEKRSASLPSVRYLILEDPADLAQGGGGDAGDWSTLFKRVAAKGADLPLLRHLHEQLGAAIHLVTVARGGGEEALSWAVAALEAAGQAP
ncbi:hypothetical protein HXX76_011681 [Chlamydomonas incerta]|uniref:Uncharacterized protein n=1 Tax=Chlamydomonas incerta TaxID=51695 RepID=A0A835STG3_CHLIN|nr:hypothetical protein HXX76_011681 [Chlamydomonas incerta]|eukprot:KAG2426450.1 hypothetical protein HXX76_011681 [Chlamydomonas incerta]